MSRLFEGGFVWGVNIDNPWTYAGAVAPKSIIIPHALSVRLPQGPVSLNFGHPVRLKKSDRSLSMTAFPDLSPTMRLELAKIFSKNLARELTRNKIRFVRIWFQWNLFQKRIVPGKDQTFQFPLDEFVHEMNSAGIGIVAVIGNGYFRFLPQGLNIDNPDVYVSRLVEASREIVRHYKGKISLWQIENEPNWWLEHFAADWRRGGVWFSPDIADRILGSLHQIVRAEDPNSPTTINLEVDSIKLSTLKSLTKYCDVLGLDFYPNYLRSQPIDPSPLIQKVAFAKEESGKPVMIAETGYPSGPKFLGFSAVNQTEYVRKVCEAARSTDSLTGLGMWRLSDSYWMSFPFQENAFGLLNIQGIPKPAWYEFAEVAKRN